jgi:glycosyltransferase involved in cell wall biosynthesis
VVEEGTGTVPVASIVVATKNRAERMTRLLEALDAQTEPRFEVIVVDDGSTDGTSERVDVVARTVAYPVRLLRNETSKGQGTARNRGWHAATAPVIVFTDDDCVPVPKWLASLLEAMEQDGLDLVSGVTGPPDDQLDQISLWSYVMVDSGRRGHFPTCNIAYRREVLDSVRGFDERFQYRRPDRSARCMIGDDTDFAWTAIDLGFRPGYAPDAVVHHDVFPQTWRQYTANKRRLEGVVLMCKKHPELAPYLGRRWIYFKEHLAVVAMVGGLVGLASRRLRPLLAVSSVAAVWYTRLYVAHRPPPPAGTGGYAVALPRTLVSDVYGAFVMLRASARYRKFLL